MTAPASYILVDSDNGDPIPLPHYTTCLVEGVEHPLAIHDFRGDGETLPNGLVSCKGHLFAQLGTSPFRLWMRASICPSVSIITEASYMESQL
jgi:hypothetical protein